MTFTGCVTVSLPEKTEDTPVNEVKESEPVKEVEESEPVKEAEESESVELKESESLKEASNDVEEVKSTNAQGISDDLYSYEVLVDGDLMKFPMSYDELTAFGWEFTYEDTEVLEGNSYTSGLTFTKGKDNAMMFRFINFSDSDKSVQDCYVGGARISAFTTEDMHIELPKGIVLEESTYDDVKEAYGEPTKEHNFDDSDVLSYKIDRWQYVDISIRKEQGTVTSIDINNMVEE